MRLLVINPNTTASMTESIGAYARGFASSDTEIIAVNPSRGPVSIEGYYDEAMCLAGLLDEIKKHPDVDVILIACFDDTGLDSARMLSSVPVIGIGEASYCYASMISNKFSVITTLSRSVPALENNLLKYGYSHKCVSVRASDIPVLDLESGGIDKVRTEISAAISEGAESIVLGCAGMSDFVEDLEREFGLPILDSIACGVSLSESMVRVGLRTSRIGGYASPPPEKIIEI